MLARKTGELGPLIALLNHPNPVIPEKVLYILNFLTSDRDSCQILGSSSPFVADFANKVVSLVTNTESTHVTSSSLRCLIRLSEISRSSHFYSPHFSIFLITNHKKRLRKSAALQARLV